MSIVTPIKIFGCFILLLASSCGYRLGKGECISKYHSIEIPYVAGDRDGLFTSSLIQAFTQNGTLKVASRYRGQLLLEVCLFQPFEENIGYTLAVKTKHPDIVVSNEGRVTLTAKVSLIDRCQGTCILSPCDIVDFLDFDFEPDLSKVEDHTLSLGQLEMQPLALEVAKEPIYRKLAQKIVDYVVHSW